MTATSAFACPPSSTASTTRTMPSQSSSLPNAGSIESLGPLSTLSTPEKTFPTRSAGPHYPSTPLSQPLLRIIPGHPRYAIPPVEWITESLPGPLLLQATLSHTDSRTATVVLPPSEPNPIPDTWFDFSITNTHAYITFMLTAGTKVCETVLLVSECSAKEGVLRRPMLDDSRIPIACLTLDFLFATAHPLGNNGNKVPFIPRFTGHRGMGSSGPKAPWRVLENSLESFAMAALPESPVKTVELDVQVTRDKKLVIFHDWFFRPCGVGGHPIYDANSVKIPIHTLTFDQLDKLYRQSYANHGIPEDDPSHSRTKFRDWAMQTHEVAEEAFDVRMRTLRQTCEMLPTEIGMLVELKYPFPDAAHGDIPYPEMNEYVDLVLDELITTNQNKGRKIAFLTFSADLCLLLSLKQSRYPVYFSHCEVLDKPCDEFDPRSIDVREGLKFVQSQGLDGLMIYNEIVKEKPDAVAEIVARQLPIITYGKSNMDKTFVQEQFQMGVSGVIADDVDVLTRDLADLSAVSSSAVLPSGNA